MTRFTDGVGKRRTLSITFETAWQMKSELGIDLLASSMKDLHLGRILAFLLASDGTLSPAERTCAFPPEVRSVALDALRRELTLFYPEPLEPLEPVSSTEKSEPNDPWRNVWRLGGRLGVDIRPLTLRQLLWMAEGEREECWDRLSALMALIANCHRRGNTPVYRVEDFHPLRRGRMRKVNREISREELARLFQNH